MTPTVSSVDPRVGILHCSGSTASPGDTGLKEERNSISFTVQSPKSQLRCQQKTEELAFPAGGGGGRKLDQVQRGGNQKAAATAPFAGWGMGPASA